MKFQIKNLFYVILVFFLLNLKAYAATNLIENGSFENSNNNQLTNWTSNAWNKEANGSEFKTESGSAKDGSKFITIKNNVNNDARYSQKVTVQENKIYKLSCYIKTENISKEGAGACISIEGKLETSKALNGTNNDWQNEEMYVKTGSGVNSITVTVGVGGYGSLSTGKAYFDNVAMEEVNSIPENAVVSEVKLDNSENKSNTNAAANSKGDSSASAGNTSGLINSLFILIILIAFAALGYYIYFIKKGSNPLNKILDIKTKNNNTEKKESKNNTDNHDDLI